MIKLFTGTTKKTWAVMAEQHGDNVLQLAADARTGEGIAVLTRLSKRGLFRCAGARRLLEFKGYNTSNTQWNEDGAIADV